MEIKPGIGVDNLKFGLKPKNIRNLLGEPDRIIQDKEYEEFEPMYIYNTLELNLTFYKKHANKLGYIRCSNKNLLINNHKIIGKPLEKVLDIFKKVINDDFVLEEYDFWTQYLNEKYWIILRFNYDTLSEIEMGVPFKNAEQYDWPK